jgi:hypothetical protein
MDPIAVMSEGVTAKDPAGACQRVLVDHEGLVTTIMAWLSVAELGRCICTCKDWSRCGSTDELWWAQCARRWVNAKMVESPWHKRTASVLGRVSHGTQQVGRGRPVVIACPPQWGLYSEEQEAAETSWWVRPSSLNEVLTWRGSLKASVLDLKRVQITDQELAGSMWALRFRLTPGASTAYMLGSFFRKDRRYIDGAIFPAEMPAEWSIQGTRVVLDAPGNPSIRRMTFNVTRMSNWGWHLYSSVYRVEIMSMQDRALVEAAAEPGAELEWPELPEDQAGGFEHEPWKEYDVYAAEDEGYLQGADPGGDDSLDSDFQQLLMGPNGKGEDEGDDGYTGCYDSPAQYPESEQSDADAHDTDPPMPAGISPRSLQRTLNEMLLYDSYGSDDLAPSPKGEGSAR